MGSFLYLNGNEIEELGLRGQAVKTSPFHGGNTGSNPVGVTKCADVAQLAEQLICNQQVIGSSPIIGFLMRIRNKFFENIYHFYMGEFPSGQRGQTVNLLASPSVVRIHLPPSFVFKIDILYRGVEQLGSSSGS